jgi:hypothetical protein
MAEKDDWGADPQVRYLRRVFSRIEQAQADLLRRVNVSPLDHRLRRVREATLGLFEDAEMRASRSGLVTSDEETATLYLYCLARVLRANRIPVADGELPVHEKIARFVSEVLK